MITTDVSKTLESLKKIHLEVVKRLENMVRKVAYEFAMQAVSNTPLGDDSEEGYAYLYRRRTELEQRAGFAQGSWQVSYSGNIPMQNIYSGAEALSKIESKLISYKLGQQITIGNTGPYIANLNNGSSGQATSGMLTPTINQIMNAHKISMSKYYKQ